MLRTGVALLGSGVIVLAFSSGCGEGRNRAPAADGQVLTTPAETAATVTLTGSDPDGDALTFVMDAQPQHGTLDAAGLPTVIYTPGPGFAGVDFFQFHVTDGALDSNVATVYIGVDNAAPSTSGLSDSTEEDTPLSLTLPGADANGDALMWVLDAQPAHGTLDLSALPDVTYTPWLNYYGNDSFMFHVTDGVDSSAVTTVDIAVTAVNDAPVAGSQSVSTVMETSVAMTLTASDAENDPLTWTIDAQPQHGTLEGTAPGLVYTPAAGYDGEDSFTFHVNDGVQDSNTATVGITVAHPNIDIWYVDIDVPVGGNGRSWATAFQHPQNAVDVALPSDWVWVAEGVYARREAVDPAVLTMTDGVAVYGGFVGTETWLSERDWVAHVSILDGEDVCSHVVVGATDARLDGFTITRGNAAGSDPADRGAGMYNGSAANLTVVNCTFSSNNASVSGGGMYNNDSSPTVTNCVFSDNAAVSSGGGMYNYDKSSPTVTNCTFNNNSVADCGGGMYNMSASCPTVMNCVFSCNSADSDSGGGMYNRSASSPTLTNCVFWGNTAVFGGGVHNCWSSSPVLTNCTISGNTAQYGAGVANRYSSTATFTNCILWGNSGQYGVEIYQDSGSPCPASYSDIGRPAFTDNGGNIDADPLFVDAANGDLRLQRASACIDAANGDAAPASDIDGSVRHDDTGTSDIGTGSPSYVDMGAYEFQGTTPTPWVWHVDKDATAGANDGSSWADAYLTLQAAVRAAWLGDVIWVAQGTYAREGTDAVVLTMKDGVAVYGGYAGFGELDPDECDPAGNLTTLDGENAVYHVVVGASDAVLDGFTVTGGNADGDSPENYGAGMYNESVTALTIANCTFTGNTAYKGGGVYNCGGSSPTVTECTFSNNLAHLWDGGGMYNSGSSAALTNCVFSGNSASRDGGGIYNGGGSPSIENCTFTNNSAQDHGGGMCSFNSSLTVTGCIFSENSTNSWDGGGMYNEQWSSPTVTNCIFIGNTAGSGGGGMGSRESSPVVTNCTFSGNLEGISNVLSFSDPVITNCVLWENGIEIDDYNSSSIVDYSNVKGGWSGAGVGNIQADPKFVDVDGTDGILGTLDDNLRLSTGSPCIDAADGDAAPEFDKDGNPRFDDPATTNAGVGSIDYADMGAYEYQGP